MGVIGKSCYCQLLATSNSVKMDPRQTSGDGNTPLKQSEALYFSIVRNPSRRQAPERRFRTVEQPWAAVVLTLGRRIVVHPLPRPENIKEAFFYRRRRSIDARKVRRGESSEASSRPYEIEPRFAMWSCSSSFWHTTPVAVGEMRVGRRRVQQSRMGWRWTET